MCQVSQFGVSYHSLPKLHGQEYHVCAECFYLLIMQYDRVSLTLFILVRHISQYYRMI
jgi:hypothetical protein